MNQTNVRYLQPHTCLPNIYSVDTVFFKFEADFIEDGVRCIPMIVRFKLDACGIKLKLHEWCKMNLLERRRLANMPCATRGELLQYRNYLRGVVLKYTGAAATDLTVDASPDWANLHALPDMLTQRISELGAHISLHQWRSMSNLQRFVLLKLSKPGYEHTNFQKAYKEFGLA